MCSAPRTICCVGYTLHRYRFRFTYICRLHEFAFWKHGILTVCRRSVAGISHDFSIVSIVSGHIPECQTCAHSEASNGVPSYSNILSYEIFRRGASRMRTVDIFTTKFVINDSNFLSFNLFNFLLRKFNCPAPTQISFELRPRSLQLIFVTIKRLVMPE